MLKKYLRLLPLFLIVPSLPAYAFHPDRYASVVIDGKTGHILHAEKANKLRYPASLTKMMTLYIVFKKLDAGALKLSDMVTVSSRAANQPPTRMGLKKGEKISVRDIIYGLVVHSANDGACAIAEHIAHREEDFAHLMTKEAHALGMKDTRFHNASGLPHASQLTTARDMILLCKALYDNFSHHAHYFATETFIFRGKAHRNHNKLLGKYGGLNGIKTGFTNRSGFNLAASAVRGHKHVIAVVLGGKNAPWRDKRMCSLIDHGFSNIKYEGKPKVYLAASTVSHLPEIRDTGPSCSPVMNSIFKEAEGDPKLASLLAGGSTVKVIRGGHTKLVSFKEEKLKEEKKPSPSSWSIQLGPYKRKPLAQKVAQSLPGLLKNSQAQLISHKRKKQTTYQVMLKGLTKAQATKACGLLKKKGHTCVVLNPKKLKKSPSI
jgi:D-alanyl-D-alanine carboxypeptidase